MKISKLVLTGMSPDSGNRNKILRHFVGEGFQKVLGAHAVRELPLERAAPIIIQETGCDMVLCFGSCLSDQVDLFSLKSVCKARDIPLVVWLHDDPYEFDAHEKITGLADVIFSNDSWSVSHYDHPHVFHLPLAASATAHIRSRTMPEQWDCFFCGVGFENRVRMIRDLSGILERCRTSLSGAEWPETEWSFCRNRRLSNETFADECSRSLVTLNLGRHFHYANERFQLDPTTPGPRTFEAAMAGATQLYFVESLEIEEYYVPGKEIVLFDTVDEFKQIIESFMEQPNRARRIGHAAQRRTMEEHTYQARASRMLEVLGGLF